MTKGCAVKFETAFKKGTEITVVVMYQSTAREAKLQGSLVHVYTVIIQQIVTLSKYGHDALDICHP